MKSLGIAVLTAVLLSGSARAQAIDLAAISCKDFLANSPDTITLLTVWLDGFYTGDDEPALFNLDKMKEKGAKLAAYCAKNPGTGLATAAEEFLGK